MSSSAITTQVAQLKIGNVQNQADTSAVYNGGIWSFKNSTALTSVTITDAGNVGIGTSSPGAALTAYKDMSSSAILRLRNTNATSRNTRIQLEDYSGVLADGLIDFKVQTAGVASSAIMQLGVNSPAMTLDASGRLLVGTNTATTSGMSSAIFQATTSSAKTSADNVAVFRTSSGGTSDFELCITRSAAGAGAYYAIQPVEQTIANRDLHLNRNGGMVQIGSQGCVINPGGGDKLLVTANGSTTGGGYFFYNSNNVYGTSSDKRLKENIEQLDANIAVDFVRNLRPVTFTYKENTAAGKVCGFIAQEVLAAAQTEEHKHIVVNQEKYEESNPDSPILGLSDHSMTPSIVATLQHLLSVVEAQAAEIAELKAKLP